MLYRLSFDYVVMVCTTEELERADQRERRRRSVILSKRN